MSTTNKFGLLVAVVIATVCSLPMFDVSWMAERVVTGAVPGATVAMMVSGNAHAFSPWIVLAANWGIYFLLFLLIGEIVRTFRAR